MTIISKSIPGDSQTTYDKHVRDLRDHHEAIDLDRHDVLMVKLSRYFFYIVHS